MHLQISDTNTYFQIIYYIYYNKIFIINNKTILYFSNLLFVYFLLNSKYIGAFYDFYFLIIM